MDLGWCTRFYSCDGKYGNNTLYRTELDIFGKLLIVQDGKNNVLVKWQLLVSLVVDAGNIQHSDCRRRIKGQRAID